MQTHLLIRINSVRDLNYSTKKITFSVLLKASAFMSFDMTEQDTTGKQWITSASLLSYELLYNVTHIVNRS